MIKTMQMIARKYPIHKQRILAQIDEIEEKLDALACFSKLPPHIIAKFFSQRDIYGVELIQLLEETKVYKFMQNKNAESAIRTNWLGKSNFNGSFMKESTAYQHLFKFKFRQKFDYETNYRSNVFSFDRQKT